MRVQARDPISSSAKWRIEINTLIVMRATRRVSTGSIRSRYAFLSANNSSSVRDAVVWAFIVSVRANQPLHST